MNSPFLVPEDMLLQLSSTRSGRISYAGYNYQCGYAVSRLASMVTRRPLFGTEDYPKYVRYDWGEDLDEVLQDDTVCFTQCKRVSDIGQPIKLAHVLLGFAPKWLWTPTDARDRVKFRLVSCDPRFRSEANNDPDKADVLDQFKNLLKRVPGLKSDRYLWQKEAETAGFDNMFNSLWAALSFIYVDESVDPGDPDGAILWSEDAALHLLWKWKSITASTRRAAILDLRCLINESVIAFDPKNEDCPTLDKRAPIRIDVADVRLALTGKSERQAPEFQVVDRVVLSKARAHRKEKFLFKSPQWHHVVHGTDKEVQFVERDQTDALQATIRELLIQPLLSGTSNLPVLFVSGPPGAGKSTLVRRVVATLVESGEVVAADAGLNLAGGPNDLRSYSKDLQDLAAVGRPVLLVLDDPLFEESGWIDLLVQLKQPGFALAAIAASPDFLFERHESQLTKLSCSRFPIAPPSPREKRQIAKIFERNVQTFGEDSDDFLVLIAEAETGEEFPRIMRRLWQTLNRGRPFDSDISFNELPWEVRAFWFVCFLHRFYTLCPLPNLKAALTLSGGTGNATDVETALSKLTGQEGWNIFRKHPAIQVWSFEGPFISTAHQIIASAAWKERPMPWFDVEVNRILVQSTIEEPQSIRSVATAAGTMAKTGFDSDVNFTKSLVAAWKDAAKESQLLDGRSISAFVHTLKEIGGPELVAPMRETLHTRASGKEGWLFALQLWFLGSDNSPSGSFPTDIDLGSLIEDADFSIAPRRAIQLFKRVVREPKLLAAVYNHLVDSLQGRLDWEPDSLLLQWMLSNIPINEIAKHLFHISSWMERHDEDSSARTQYLSFLKRLPETFDERRERAITDTEQWLKRHDENSDVRTQYLTFLHRLPPAFDEQRRHAVFDTEEWLKRHDENSDVRTQYLTFLLGLPPAFDEQRRQAVIDTEEWLKRHDENSDVRTQYLTFLLSLPEEFDEQRIRAAQATAAWLNRHPNSLDVLAQYVSFLLDVPLAELDPLRQTSDKYHQELIAKSPAFLPHYFNYGDQLLRLSRLDEAITQFDVVLKRNKGHQHARRKRAQALQKLGRIQEAEAEFKHALWWARFKKQSQAVFHTSLAEFYLEIGHEHEAINSFKEAQKEFPEHFRNHWGIAKAQFSLGNLNEAENAIQLALKDKDLKSPAKEEIILLRDQICGLRKPAH